MDTNIIAFIKTFSTVVGSVWSFIVGAMGWAFPTLIILMASDFLSGTTAGSKKEVLSSARGRESFVKKVHILIIVGSVYLLEKVIFGTQHLGDGVTVAYIIIEFISIAENGRLGVPSISEKTFAIQGRVYKDESVYKLCTRRGFRVTTTGCKTLLIINTMLYLQMIIVFKLRKMLGQVGL
ncbi:phage holin family protein [Bacillus sp. 03113]|uniref:phage holin family protein n=1 Tax=Bacillus sp. 03113 TaxID=2578211 RepID=UPI0011432FF1|nr:phage holin family protein [Bacillus sp. 03113]